MAFRKHVMITAVVLGIAGIILGCGSDETVNPVSPQAEAPLIAPSNLTAMLLPNGDISLRWDAGSQTNLRGYNVYRVVFGEITKLTATPVAVNSYTDTTPLGRSLNVYRVSAVSTSGAESRFVSVQINGFPGFSGKGKKYTD